MQLPAHELPDMERDTDTATSGDRIFPATQSTNTQQSLQQTPEEGGGAVRSGNFFTRNGLNLESFKQRDYGRGIVEFDRSMKSRHLNMIAIGGSIGAGFFVGSGSALAKGGPGTLLIDFLIIGTMIFNVVHALGELAVMYPVSGGFYTYASRFIDPAWGFAAGWNYVMGWGVVLPLELTVCSLTIGYWDPEGKVSVSIWITIFFLLIIVVNLFGTLGYAEEEFISAVIKLGATVVFIILSLVLVLGGGPKNGQYGEYWGARLWYDPGAFHNGFLGFCSVFVTAAFAFSGTELVGLGAAEAANPVKALPGAIKQVFWRITLFYILGLSFVGLLIPYDDPNLLGSGDYIDVSASPFVLVGKYAGLVGFDSFMNVVILISVLSIGVSAVYGGSRTLTALAQQGYAPQIFTYVDRAGRHSYSVAGIIAFGLLAYINLSTSGSEIFAWLQAIAGLAALFSWGSICLAHIRFRQAWAYNGMTLDEIPFKAAGGVAGSYVGLIMVVIVLIAQFYVAIQTLNAKSFFQAYLAAPVVILFYIIGYLWKREGWRHIKNIDIHSGRRVINWEEVRAHRQQIAALPAWKRLAQQVF